MGKVKKFLRKFEPDFKGIAKKIEPRLKKGVSYKKRYVYSRKGNLVKTFLDDSYDLYDCARSRIAINAWKQLKYGTS